MGIVMAVVMLLGISVRWPLPLLHNIVLSLRPISIHVISTLLLLAGLWNSLWFGLRHIDQFWGIAAIVSGVAMVIVAVLIAKEYGDKSASYFSHVCLAYRYLQPIAIVAHTILLCSFVLYAVTLIQLNLGMDIIR